MYMIEITEDKKSKIMDCLHRAKELLCDVEEVFDQIEDHPYPTHYPRSRSQYRMGGSPDMNEPIYPDSYRERYRMGGRY